MIMKSQVVNAIKKVEDATKSKCDNIKDIGKYYILECRPEKAKNKGIFLDYVFAYDKSTGDVIRYNPLIMNGK